MFNSLFLTKLNISIQNDSTSHYKRKVIRLAIEISNKNGNAVTLKLSSNIIGTNETDLPRKLLLSDEKISIPPTDFRLSLTVNINLSKTQLFEIIPPGEFLGRLLKKLKKVTLLLMEYEPKT